MKLVLYNLGVLEKWQIDDHVCLAFDRRSGHKDKIFLGSRAFARDSSVEDVVVIWFDMIDGRCVFHG